MAVCTVCGEQWQRHLKYAKYRLEADNDDDGDVFAYDAYGDIVVTDTDVSLEDCVDALRQRNKGPMGPAGPMGPMGMSAR